jgi:uncharacterized protein (DUF1778 family)
MTKDAQISVRLPAELRRWLDQQAEQERRSLGNFVVLKLEEIKQQAEKSGGGEARQVG